MLQVMDPTVAKEPARTTPPEFARFFRENYRRLARGTLLLTGDRWEAEDLAQEALARVYEKWDKVAAMDSPSGYLYRTALNLHRNRLRAITVRTRRTFAGGHERDPLLIAEERLDVLRAVSALPPAQKEALVLVDWLDLDVQEAASLLGIQAVSVRGRLHRARRTLRQGYGDEDD